MNDDDKNKIIMSIMPVFILLAIMMSTASVRAYDTEVALENTLENVHVSAAYTVPDKYLAIAASDRITLKFNKPQH